MAFTISNRCTSCEACVSVCPTESIFYGVGQFVIDSDSCCNSRVCVEVCPEACIHPGDPETEAKMRAIADEKLLAAAEAAAESAAKEAAEKKRLAPAGKPFGGPGAQGAKPGQAGQAGQPPKPAGVPFGGPAGKPGQPAKPGERQKTSGGEDPSKKS